MYEQEHRYADLDPAEVRANPDAFVELLGVRPPPLAEETALTQLRYLASYVVDPVIGCKSVLIEEQYVDRDHMEDHSVFYSRNLFQYSNFCRRVHFFSVPRKDVEEALDRLAATARDGGLSQYDRACRQFSRDAYIGFSVIKPLDGTPVGRTVLRCFPPQKEGRPDYRRDFACTREYTAHVAGVALRVTGLPFQQQDKAVAACATTALWSALHRAREFEEIAPFTPAQITDLASRSSLIFDRAMPSEGLSIDQMCQAVQAVGISPVLARADDASNARALLYSSVKSGISPVLIVSDDWEEPTLWHAVAGTGMGIQAGTAPVTNSVEDVAGQLEALYVHDDRIGPYLRADVSESDGHLVLDVDFRPEKGLRHDRWYLRYILFPMHAKIRITFGTLREIGTFNAVSEVQTFREGRIEPQYGKIDNSVIRFETWISRSFSYVERLLLDPEGFDLEILRTLVREVSLPRYVGVVRLSSDFFATMDLLIDTTSTDRNLHAVALLAGRSGAQYTLEIAKHLANQLDCKLITSER